MNQFLQHPIDSRNEIIEAYLIGSRLIHFLSAILPTHPDYFSNRQSLALLRDKAQSQLVELSGYIEVIAKMLDRQEHERYISYVLEDRVAAAPNSTRLHRGMEDVSTVSSRPEANDDRRYQHHHHDDDNRTHDDATLDDYRSVQNQELEELSQSIDSARHDDWDSAWVKQHSRMHAVLDQEASVVTEEESVSLSREYPNSTPSEDLSQLESTQDTTPPDSEYLPFNDSTPSPRKSHSTSNSPPSLSPPEERRQSFLRPTGHHSEGVTKERIGVSKPLPVDNNIRHGTPSYPKPEHTGRMEHRQDTSGPYTVSSSRSDGSDPTAPATRARFRYEGGEESLHHRGKEAREQRAQTFMKVSDETENRTIPSVTSATDSHPGRRMPIGNRHVSGLPPGFTFRQDPSTRNERPPPYPEPTTRNRRAVPSNRLSPDRDVLEDPDPEPPYYEEDDSQCSESVDLCYNPADEGQDKSRRPPRRSREPWAEIQGSQSAVPTRDSRRNQRTPEWRLTSEETRISGDRPSKSSEHSPPERKTSDAFSLTYLQQQGGPWGAIQGTESTDHAAGRESGAFSPTTDSFVVFPGSDFFRSGKGNEGSLMDDSGHPGGSGRCLSVKRNSNTHERDVQDLGFCETSNFLDGDPRSKFRSSGKHEYGIGELEVVSERTRRERPETSDALGHGHSEPRFMVNITVDGDSFVCPRPVEAENVRSPRESEIPHHRQATARASAERLEALRARRLAHQSRDVHNIDGKSTEAMIKPPRHDVVRGEGDIAPAMIDDTSVGEQEEGSGGDVSALNSDSRSKQSAKIPVRTLPKVCDGSGSGVNTSFQSIENDSVLNGEVEQVIVNASAHNSDSRSKPTSKIPIRNPSKVGGGSGSDINTSFQSIENDSALNGEVEQIIFHESLKRSKYESFQTRATESDLVGCGKMSSPDSKCSSGFFDGYETADEESIPRHTFDPFSDTEDSEQLDLLESRRKRDALIEAMRLEQVSFLESSPPRAPDHHILKPSPRDVAQQRQIRAVVVPPRSKSTRSQPVDLDDTVDDDRLSEEDAADIACDDRLPQQTLRIRSLLFPSDASPRNVGASTRIEQRLEDALTNSVSSTSPNSVLLPPTKGSNLKNASHSLQGSFAENDDDTEMINAFALKKRRPLSQFRGCVRCLLE